MAEKFLINTANARELAAKSAIKRKELKQERELNLRNMEMALAAKTAPEPVQTEAIPVHTAKSLNRVRKQIQLVNAQLEQSISDPDSSNKYSSALERLYRIEQGLSMRPSPGSLRPTSKQVRTRQDISPIEPV